ncbi:MAG: Hsp20/alpha crystallin family protein [Bacteroidia bacterium]|nr:Hsp20/alpha crystallin family protein [Bacteroidia bacterium]MDW8300895.1 Hsp20/alpha crystallin family protein [Bacteroidia bacterium]
MNEKISLVSPFLKPSLFDEVFSNLFKVEEDFNFMPRTDIKETADDYKIEIAIPGVKKEDITIEQKENYLIVTAEHKESREENTTYHLKEIKYGKYKRSFRLPNNIQKDNIQAKFENGILTITLPKMPVQEPVKQLIRID